MIEMTFITPSGAFALFPATATTEAVNMIAIVMAIRVRVRFLKVYTSFLVGINPPPDSRGKPHVSIKQSSPAEVIIQHICYFHLIRSISYFPLYVNKNFKEINYDNRELLLLPRS
jgi:hypothetical protein